MTCIKCIQKDGNLNSKQEHIEQQQETIERFRKEIELLENLFFYADKSNWDGHTIKEDAEDLTSRMLGSGGLTARDIQLKLEELRSEK